VIGLNIVHQVQGSIQDGNLDIVPESGPEHIEKRTCVDNDNWTRTGCDLLGEVLGRWPGRFQDQLARKTWNIVLDLSYSVASEWATSSGQCSSSNSHRSSKE